MGVMKYMKAIASAVVTGLGTLQVSYTDNVVTNQEWVSIAISTIVALGAVWAIPNAATAVRSYRKKTTKTPTAVKVVLGK